MKEEKETDFTEGDEQFLQDLDEKIALMGMTPEDQRELQSFSNKSEWRLRENEIPYEEWMERFRRAYGQYEDNQDVEPNYLEKMTRDFEQVYVGADNPPDKQRAVEDFLKEIRGQEK